MILSQLRRPGLQNAGPPAGGFGEAESTLSCPGGRCGRAIRGPPCCALSNIDKPNCVATEMGCYWGVFVYIYIYVYTYNFIVYICYINGQWEHHNENISSNNNKNNDNNGSNE